MVATTAQNQNIMAAASYLLGPITGILFLVLEKENQFIRFHAMQSTILFGGLWVLSAGLGFVPYFGPLAGMVLSLLSFVLWVVLLWKAFSGEEYEVAYVGELARRQLRKL